MALDVKIVKNLRLVPHKGSVIDAKQHFHTVVLRLIDERSCTSVQETLKNLREILASETLRRLIRKVIVMGKLGTQFKEAEVDVGEDIIGSNAAYVDVPRSDELLSISKLPLVKEVEFGLNNVVSLDGDVSWDGDEEYRQQYHGLLFEALEELELVEHLTIGNILAAHIHYDYTRPGKLSLAMRQRLTKLALMVLTSMDDLWQVNIGRYISREFDLLPVHQCFNTGLLERWVRPTQLRLTHLALYYDSYWAVWPFADLRGVYFPRLLFLALRRWTIAHD
ncbi:hypothetical protein P280DRAFT_536337 [Massarina eburnea CBS 473.64]|uniref:Uncharacterized protein n=1 Tax=Massarina eburnea CBS 473.64 TaxID=1395130 RepID=A0A6A6RK02_9PLEO|nr:hypothetical protein P280DRAFT_536337 [Massarina eburnea CBS 473.64]